MHQIDDQSRMINKSQVISGRLTAKVDSNDGPWLATSRCFDINSPAQRRFMEMQKVGFQKSLRVFLVWLWWQWTEYYSMISVTNRTNWQGNNHGKDRQGESGDFSRRLIISELWEKVDLLKLANLFKSSLKRAGIVRQKKLWVEWASRMSHSFVKVSSHCVFVARPNKLSSSRRPVKVLKSLD